VLTRFLSYYPLKQGLKPTVILIGMRGVRIFLSYYPLKQGLKQKQVTIASPIPTIFILLSIKTRIETGESMLPVIHPGDIFILLSIKTRIETERADKRTLARNNFYPTIH